MKRKCFEPLTSSVMIEKLSIIILLIYFVVTSAGCVASSSNPSFDEIIKTGIPTFGGKTNASLTTATESYILNGECDPKSKALDWSYDSVNWIPITAGCVASAFSVTVVVPHQKTVYVRAKTEVGFTAPGVAKIDFTLPAAGSAMQLVTSGSQIDNGEAGVQFTMNPISTGKPMLGTAVQMDMDVTGIVYDGH